MHYDEVHRNKSAIYTVSQKRGATIFLTVTLSNVD